MIKKTWIDFENEISHVICTFEQLDFNIQTENSVNSESGVMIKADNREKITILMPFLSLFSKVPLELKTVIPICLSVETKNEFIEYLFDELNKFTQVFEYYCFNEIDALNSKYMSENQIEALRNEISTTTKEVSDYKIKVDQAYNKYQQTQQREAELKQKTFDEEKYNFHSIGKPSSHRQEWVTTSSQLRNDKDEMNSMQSSYTRRSDSLATATLKYNEHLEKHHLIMKNNKFDAVLSFNYTHTFQILYGNSSTKYCYIHGEAQNVEKTNLILGIDDKLDRNSANSKFEFVKFKKYFQRILYKTGSEYKDWLNDNASKITIYIVGHSLDKTDHDVLREFFDKKCKIVICYFNEDDYLDKIQKVISIIGKDELIKRVHGSEWLIKFVDQCSPDGVFDNFSEIT